MSETKLILDNLALSHANHLGYYGVAGDLSGKLVVEGAGEDVYGRTLDQLFNHFERTRVAGHMQWSPVFASTWLLEIECLHLVLLKHLVDREHPSECIKTEAFRGHVDVGPSCLLGSSQVGP